MRPIILIPAYQPSEQLIELVTQLRIQQPDQEMLIINDGSHASCDAIFSKLEILPNITVLHHAVNLGKGQALKTGFNYFLTHYPPTCPGVITADADGQHLPDDILKLSTVFSHDPNALHLGSRAFDHNVPWKSQFGNTLTKYVFRTLIGQSIRDTQTGLRAIPRDFLRSLLKTNSNGYEFELDMLIKATRQHLPIRETTITTVYNNNNKGSHFNPIIDSLKIYFVFLRFLVFAIVSGLLDFLAFSLGFFFTGHIFLSEGLARVFSGTCNFLFNKSLVFKSKASLRFEALKYALLCAVNLVFSYAFIQSLIYINVNVYISKLIALFGLFIANFAIQKLIVFADPNPKPSLNR